MMKILREKIKTRYIYMVVYSIITMCACMMIYAPHSRFEVVYLFNGISTFVGYFMPMLFSYKNSSGTI